jgi:hypothetical protein
MHPERVDITRVTAVIVAIIVAAVVGVTATIRAFWSLLLGHLFQIVEVIVLTSGTHELGLLSSE